MTTPTVDISKTSSENSGKENFRISIAAILVQAIGSLGPLAYLSLAFLANFFTDIIPAGAIEPKILFSFVLSWSLVNAINLLIELKLKRFNVKDFFKKTKWFAIAWLIPWIIFFFYTNTNAPQDPHSIEYEMFEFGQGLNYWIFIFLTAALWPLVATFFKNPSFKRELVVLLISIQVTILTEILIYIFKTPISF